jgi:hypothetical protein
MVFRVAGAGSRLRQALSTNVNAPTVWLTAVFALLGLIIGALIALALGLRNVSLAAGFVAAFAGVAGGLVPPGLTRQVAVPAGVAVAVGPALALLGEGRPVVAGLLAAAVFAVGALMQQDVPTGAVAGALGATAYVLAVGMALVRSVPLSDVVLAGLIGLATAALTTLASRTVRGWLVRRGRASAAPEVPSLPGRAASRLMSGMGSALGDWRYNAYVRLALRRVIVLAPLVAVLEARRDPVALYALIVAFSVTQPTASDTVNRALARTAGTIAAILVTFALAACCRIRSSSRLPRLPWLPASRISCAAHSSRPSAQPSSRSHLESSPVPPPTPRTACSRLSSVQRWESWRRCSFRSPTHHSSKPTAAHQVRPRSGITRDRQKVDWSVVTDLPRVIAQSRAARS